MDQFHAAKERKDILCHFGVNLITLCTLYFFGVEKQFHQYPIHSSLFGQHSDSPKKILGMVDDAKYAFFGGNWFRTAINVYGIILLNNMLLQSRKTHLKKI